MTIVVVKNFKKKLKFSELELLGAYRISDAPELEHFVGAVGIAIGSDETCIIDGFVVLKMDNIDNGDFKGIIITKDDGCVFEEIDCEIVFSG